MPMYLGTVIFIFCLLQCSVGDSQEGEHRRHLRPCTSGGISNCEVNRDTPGKRETRRVMRCCLAYFFPHFISFPYHSPCCSLNFTDCVILPSERRTDMDFKGGRKRMEAQTLTSEWTLLRRGSALTESIEMCVCNWVRILFPRILFSKYFVSHQFCWDLSLCTKHSALYICAKCKIEAWQANLEYILPQ